MRSLESLGQLISDARTKKGLTQDELGKHTGVSANTIARIERGEQDPRYSTLALLFDALGIDPSKLNSNGS